jgi:hypothetical protein
VAFGVGEEKTMADWEVYESVAAYLLNKISSEFGLERVEGKQKLIGQRSGTTWEIDAKGFCRGKADFVIIECRRNITSKQNQEKIGGLAYRIIDTGATGGIIVSPLGLQEGAERVALAENIVGVALNENCTKDIFVLRFHNKIICGLPDPLSMVQRFGRMKWDCIP